MLALGILAAIGASVLYNTSIALQALEARDVPHEHSFRVSLIGIVATAVLSAAIFSSMSRQPAAQPRPGAVPAQPTPPPVIVPPPTPAPAVPPRGFPVPVRPPPPPPQMPAGM